MKLAFRIVEGPPQGGAPLVIMHGVFGSSDNWLTVSKQMALSRTLYLLDLRNHGRSPHSEVFTYEAMGSDLSEFLDDQNLPQVHLLGHSMGGKAAMLFAAAHPERLKSLVVVDISPRPYPAHHGHILEALTSLNLAETGTRNQADAHLSTLIPEPDVRAFLLKNLYRDENNRFAWRINLPVIDRDIENIGIGLPPHTKISLPALFIKGAGSKYITPSDELEIHRLFSNVNIVSIPGAGHWVQAEQPQAFAEAVNAFLAPLS